jgi:hypothetical protein
MEFSFCTALRQHHAYPRRFQVRPVQESSKVRGMFVKGMEKAFVLRQ